MRRNSRILLLFGIIWFSGVYLYVRNSENTSGVYNAESNPRHGNRVSKDAHEKHHKKDHKEKIKPAEVHNVVEDNVRNKNINADKLEHDIQDIEHGLEDLEDTKNDEFAAIEDSIRHDLANNDNEECIDTLGNTHGGGTLGMYRCHGDGGNQEFTLTKEGKEFRHNDLCIGYNSKEAVGNPVKFNTCHQMSHQRWEYFGSQIKPEGHTNLCLDSKNHLEKGLTLEVCNHSRTQVFSFEMRNIK